MYIKHIVNAPNFNSYRYSRAPRNDTFPGKKGGEDEEREGKRENGEGERLFSTFFYDQESMLLFRPIR